MTRRGGGLGRRPGKQRHQPKEGTQDPTKSKARDLTRDIRGLEADLGLGSDARAGRGTARAEPAAEAGDARAPPAPGGLREQRERAKASEAALERERRLKKEAHKRARDAEVANAKATERASKLRVIALNLELKDELAAIEGRLRVSTSMESLLRAIDKEFSLCANYPKGHGELFRIWMEKHHPGALLLHVVRTGGSRQARARAPRPRPAPAPRTRAPHPRPAPAPRAPRPRPAPRAPCPRPRPRSRPRPRPRPRPRSRSRPRQNHRAAQPPELAWGASSRS